MGKKKSGRQSSATTTAVAAVPTATPAARAFVLKVPTHCQCTGCGDKIRAAVKGLTLRYEGILSLDQSALATKGELAVVATADPEKLRRRLRKATGKTVDLVFPKPSKPAVAKPAAAKDAAAATAATLQALLAGLQLQQQQQPVVHAHHGHLVPSAAAGTWNALQQGGYAQAYAAYPWVLPQQQQVALPPEPYLPSYPAVAYPNAASWGAFAAYPHDNGLGGAYGGGGWFGL